MCLDNLMHHQKQDFSLEALGTGDINTILGVYYNCLLSIFEPNQYLYFVIYSIIFIYDSFADF